MGKSFTSANFGSIAANTPTVVPVPFLSNGGKALGSRGRKRYRRVATLTSLSKITT
jgi:hypothetical protein